MVKSISRFLGYSVSQSVSVSVGRSKTTEHFVVLKVVFGESIEKSDRWAAGQSGSQSVN